MPRPQYYGYNPRPAPRPRMRGRAMLPPRSFGRFPTPYHHPAPPRFVRPENRKTQVKCSKCGIDTFNIKEHNANAHKIKKFGFQCKVCSHFESANDIGLMKKHLVRYHPESNIEARDCSTFIDKGYERAERCEIPGCFFKAPSQLELGMHMARQHAAGPVIESYNTIRTTAVPTLTPVYSAPSTAPAPVPVVSIKTSPKPLAIVPDARITSKKTKSKNPTTASDTTDIVAEAVAQAGVDFMDTGVEAPSFGEGFFRETSRPSLDARIASMMTSDATLNAR